MCVCESVQGGWGGKVVGMQFIHRAMCICVHGRIFGFSCMPHNIMKFTCAFAVLGYTKRRAFAQATQGRTEGGS